MAYGNFIVMPVKSQQESARGSILVERSLIFRVKVTIPKGELQILAEGCGYLKTLIDFITECTML